MLYKLAGRSLDRAWRRSRQYTAKQIRLKCLRTGSTVVFDRTTATIKNGEKIVAKLVADGDGGASNELARTAYAALLRSNYGIPSDAPAV